MKNCWIFSQLVLRSGAISEFWGHGFFIHLLVFVGGWFPNPFEKYFPKFRGENKKYLKPPPSWCLLNKMFNMMKNHSLSWVFRCTHPKFFQSPNCVFVASPTLVFTQPSQPNVSFCVSFLWVFHLDFWLILKVWEILHLRWNSRDDSTNTNLRLRTAWKNRMCALITAHWYEPYWKSQSFELTTVPITNRNNPLSSILFSPKPFSNVPHVQQGQAVIVT